MKQLSVILKSALVALCLLPLTSIRAEHKRVPDPGRGVVAQRSDYDPQAAKSLKKFIGQFSKSNTKLETTDNRQLFRNVKQRPERVMRSLEMPKGDFYVVIAQAMSPGWDYTSSCYSHFDPNSGKLNNLYSGSVYNTGMDTEVQSGVVRNNILYMPIASANMATGDVRVLWKRVDLSTGTILPSIDFGMTANGLLMFQYSMTYDPVEDVIYGMSIDYITGKGGTLVKVDCSNPDESKWQPEHLAELGGNPGDYVCGIVFNPDQRKLFGLKDNGQFNRIDIEKNGNGYKVNTTIVKEFDDFENDYCFPVFPHALNMCYSPYDHAYYFLYESDPLFIFAGIDARSYEATEIYQFGYPIRFGLVHCTDNYANDDAPDVVSMPKFNFNEASIQGTYTATMPETTFNGIALTSDVTYHVIFDGNEIYTGTHNPGEEVTLSLATTQGYHHMVVYASMGDLKGPDTESYVYVGYDQPKAPTNVAYANGKITWRAPSNVGVHNGYLDLSDLSYNVFLNGQKITELPVRETQLDFDATSVATGKNNFTVTAISHGVESEASVPFTRTIGKGVELPAFFPTNVEIENSMFEIYNANHDAYKFEYAAPNWGYTDANGNPIAAYHVYTTDYTVAPDDWLFLPPVYLDSNIDIYTLSYLYKCANVNSRFMDNLDIFIGSDPTPDAMKVKIYSHKDRPQLRFTEETVKFTVDKPGTYYIGYHSYPGNTTFFRGTALTNFSVEKRGDTTDAPADPTNVTVAPGDKGDLKFDVTLTMPTKTISGNDIPADTDITIFAKTEGAEDKFTGKPGETISFSLFVPSDGAAVLYLTPASDKGEGLTRYYQAYVGFDTPLPPANVKGILSDDNMTVTLSWDPVSTVGVQGGYVDLDEVTYDIYTQSIAGAVKVGAAGPATTYDFRTGAVKQSKINVGPVARNSVGESFNGTFFTDILGRPYQVPFKEEWGLAAFNYSPWTFTTTGEFAHVSWDHATPGIVYGKEVVFKEGSGLLAYSETIGKSKGEMVTPKISTANVPNVRVKFSYWDYPNAGEMECWARCSSNQVYQKIASKTPLKLDGEWQEWQVNLPQEFSNQGWVQISLRVNISSGENVIIDSFQLVQNTDYDFMITSAEGPYSAFIGETPVFNVVVSNSGDETASGTLTAELLVEGEVAQKEVVEISRLRSTDTFEHSVAFEMIEKYMDASDIMVRFTTEAEGDQNPNNNEAYVDFILNDHSLPIVRDLKAKRLENGKDVELTWNEPNSDYKPLESFENVPAFGNTKQIDRWTNIDLDGKEPFRIAGYDWYGSDKPSAWQVFDAVEAGTMNDERLCPHSGTRMLIARSCAYDETADAPTRSFDWLVSPEIKSDGDNPIPLSFWMNTISSQYTETIQVWISTTDNHVGDGKDLILDDKDVDPKAKPYGSFRWFQNFTKSGEEAWEKCETMLPANVRYIAFVYASFGQFAATLDDIEVPLADPGKMDIAFYSIYRSVGNETPIMVGDDVMETSYVHNAQDDTKATYYVVTNVSTDGEYFEGPLSNPAFVDGSGVGELEAGQFIGGGKGKILVGGAAGKNLTIYDIDGRVILSSSVNADRMSIPCEAGIYMVRLEEATVKVIVR